MLVDIPILNNLLEFTYKNNDGSALNEEALQRLMTAILGFSYYELIKIQVEDIVEEHIKQHSFTKMNNKDV